MSTLTLPPARTVATSAGRRPDPHALSTWGLACALVLFLGFSGGGYAGSVSGRAGIAVWWCVVVACGWGLLPAARLSRLALAALGAFGLFTLWTTLGITLSISSGRRFQDIAVISTYFAIFVLAVSIHRERHAAIRHTVGAVATALSILAAVSLATRLWPGFIPSATHVAQADGRLSWPLDYWNALAAMTAMALVLLLSIATSSRRPGGRALAAAAVPVVALAGALTQSRGGVLEIGAAVIVWLILTHRRVLALVTVTSVGGASAILISLAFADRGIRTGRGQALGHAQATDLGLALLGLCAAVAVVQVGLAMLDRRTRPLRWTPTLQTRVFIWTVGVVICVIAAASAHLSRHLSHAWADFKDPGYQSALTNHLSASSGEGRYQYWVAAVHSAAGHPLTGSGPGTFQLDWLPRAHIDSYVINAHSLYVETYAELGIVGLGLLALFIVLCLAGALRAVRDAEGSARTLAAGICAALVAFFVGAAFDWLWQMPVLVAAVLLLAAAVLAPHAATRTDLALDAGAESAAGPRAGRAIRFSGRRLLGLGAVIVAVAGLAAVIYPLSVSTAVGNSQRAAAAGDTTRALAEARHAVHLEPASGAAQLQLALVLESRHEFPSALHSARAAVSHDRDNWLAWLTLSRLDAENGLAHASLAAFDTARSLNPQSSLFTL